MSICHTCGIKWPDTERFCKVCGTALDYIEPVAILEESETEDETQSRLESAWDEYSSGRPIEEFQPDEQDFITEGLCVMEEVWREEHINTR